MRHYDEREKSKQIHRVGQKALTDLGAWLLQVALGIVVGTAIIFTGATLIKYTEFPGSESDLTLQGMAMIIGYGIVMLGVCMLGCVVPTRRALNIEPTSALRTE